MINISFEKIKISICFITMDNEDYFDLKYLEDVYSLFQDLIQINQFYNLNLFQKNNNFTDLHNFIIKNTEFIEYDNIDSDDELLILD